MPQCKNCQAPHTLDMPLIRCIKCTRSYHAKCHRPIPTNSATFICKKCSTAKSERRSNDGTTSTSTSLLTKTNSSSIISTKPFSSVNITKTSAKSAMFSSFISEGTRVVRDQCCFPDCPNFTTESPLCAKHIHLANINKQTKLPSSTPLLTTTNNARLATGAASAVTHQSVLPKTTARKTAPSASYQYAQDAKAKHNSSSSQSRKVNGSSASPKPPSRGQAGFSPPDSPTGSSGPARKKLRMFTSVLQKEDVSDPRFSRVSLSHSRESSASNGVSNSLHDRQEIRDSPSLPCNRQSANANGLPDAPRATQEDVHPTDVQNGHSTTPISMEDSVSGQISSPHIGEDFQRSDSSFNRGVPSKWRELGARRQEYSITESESDHVRTVSKTVQNGIASPRRSGQRLTAAKARSLAKSRAVSKSLYTDLKPIVRTPTLEQRRHDLAEAHEASKLDAFVYGQKTSSEPPASVKLPHPRAPRERDASFFADIDPRLHWSRPHTQEWHEDKAREIKERGGRKANLGKATERMKEQRLKNGPVKLEDKLPHHVRNNPSWLAAMHWFEINSQESAKRDKDAAGAKEKRRRKRAATVLCPTDGI